MKVRYALAPQAALDLVEIWPYSSKRCAEAMVERLESAIRDKMIFRRKHDIPR
jgi:hypothetical protein